jgi:hypothetical protein
MPERIYTPTERPFETVRHVGVAVKTIAEGQSHIGLVHKDQSSNQIMLLDLAWHHRLRNDAPDASYVWIDPALPAPRARQIAALCRKIWRSNPEGIPYAFSGPSDCFSAETGAFLLGPTRRGLTCASFVLAVFHAAGFPLAQYETWPPASELDRAWQRHVLEMLRESGASLEHIQAVEGNVGAVRYRPEEVGGAAASDSLPAEYKDAARLGQRILEKLRGNGLGSPP